MSYVDKEMLLKDIDKSLYENPHRPGVWSQAHRNEHNHFYNMVMRQPYVDAVNPVRCRECIYNVANMDKDPLDATDYSGKDIVCSYFQTDGLHLDDFCSNGERMKKDGD